MFNWLRRTRKEEPVVEVKPEIPKVKFNFEKRYKYWPYRVIEVTMKSGRKCYQVNRGRAYSLWEDDVRWTEFVNEWTEIPEKFQFHDSQLEACKEAQRLQNQHKDTSVLEVKEVTCDLD